MIKLNKKTEYALIAVTHLAAHPESRVSARDLARDYNVPADLMAKVLQQLHSAGLIQSQQGSHGGYTISCDPATVKLNAFITLMEGPIGFVECTRIEAGHEPECEQLEHCNILGPLREINDRINSLLDSYSLADLIIPHGNSGLVPLSSIQVKSPTASAV